jgi:hypothetical protein
MNIDLLVNKDGDFGLVATGRFDNKISGVIFDHKDYLLSLEFSETMETMALNVPVDPSYVSQLATKQRLHMIGTDKKLIHEAYSVPLYHVNDSKTTSESDWA